MKYSVQSFYLKQSRSNFLKSLQFFAGKLKDDSLIQFKKYYYKEIYVAHQILHLGIYTACVIKSFISTRALAIFFRLS